MKAGKLTIRIEKTKFDYVNKKAKIVLVGITPGNNQLEGERDSLNAREIKRRYAFAGNMRPNLIHMLDFIGVHNLLRIRSCESLWDDAFDLVEMTSLLKDATFIISNGKNKVFADVEKISRYPQLGKAFQDGFLSDCALYNNAVLFVALGKQVYQKLCELKENGHIRADIVAVANPSGANMGRIQYFLNNKNPLDEDGKWYKQACENSKSIINKLIKTSESFYDSLLKSRNYLQERYYLWELKVTDEEYNQLCELLSNHVQTEFRGLERELCLFCAEYWKREYEKGNHNYEDILRPITKSTNISDTIIQSFSKALKIGSKALPIEPPLHRYLDAVLYQGGLPLKAIERGGNQNYWYRLAKQWVHDGGDFKQILEKLNLDNYMDCFQPYCDSIIEAIELKDSSLMPFSCDSEQHRWYQLFSRLSELQRTRNVDSSLFKLNFEFTIDNVQNQISAIVCHVKGRQDLQKSFLQAHNLNNNSFTVSVMDNDLCRSVFQYDEEGFCWDNVDISYPYTMGHEISICLNGEPFIRRSIDWIEPLQLHLGYNGKYYTYKERQNNGQSWLLLLPKSWRAQTDRYEMKTYHYNDIDLQCIIVEGVDEVVEVVNEENQIIKRYGAEINQNWISVRNPALFLPLVDQPLYDATNCRYNLCSDSNEEARLIQKKDIEYCNTRSDRWTKEPAYGRLWVRTIQPDSGVAPIQIVNIGNRDSLIISPQWADEQNCRMTITWKHGSVRTSDGKRDANDPSVWIFNRTTENNNRIHLRFTPTDTPKNEFELAVVVPFRSFNIKYLDYRDIPSESVLALADRNSYRYHIEGYEIDSIEINGRNVRLARIQSEGGLNDLLGEDPKILLDRTSQAMQKASINVVIKFRDNARESYKLTIKEYPFELCQIDDNIFVRNANGDAINSERIKVIPLDDPCSTPQLLIDDGEGYRLPYRDRDETAILIYSSTIGRVLPKIIWNHEENVVPWETADLCDPTWERAMKWLKRSRVENIPPCCIPDLKSIADKSDYLICFTFQLFAYENDSEKLNRFLRDFSRGLAFQWHWLLKKLSNSAAIIDRHGGENGAAFEELLNHWAKENNIQPDTDAMFKAYTEWMKELCKSSLLDSYTGNDNQSQEIADSIILYLMENGTNGKRNYEMQENMRDIDENQNFLDRETIDFYKSYNVFCRNRNLTTNEQWLMQRVGILVQHFQGDIDLFSQPEPIRRSLIYCSKSHHNIFIFELYNNLP